MKVFRSIAAAAALGAFSVGVFGGGAANADPGSYSSYSQVNPVGGDSASDTGTSSSSVVLDANNYAKSFITPGTSVMGAAVAADPSVSYNPSTQTIHDDSWYFKCDATHICGSLPLSKPIPLQLTFGIKVSETQVTGGDAYLEFDANYRLSTGGAFSFSFAQDGPGDFELSSDYVDASGVHTPIPVVSNLVDGVWNLSVNATVHNTVCGLGSVCIPLEMSCDPGATCGATPAFTDEQSITALIDSNRDAGPDMIDGYDPFSLEIVSLDPNFQLVSGDGRGIGPAAPGGVPEPAAWAMLLVGFAGIGCALRRRAPGAARAA